MARAATKGSPPVTKPKRELSLLDLAKGLPQAQAKRQAEGRSKADDDYVKPQRQEIARGLTDLIDLGEIVVPKGAAIPPKLSKLGRPALVALAESLDPYDKVSERATLLRLLKTKKVKVPNQCPTHELVWLAMQSGCFGRENKRRTTIEEAE
jgi:hypothetical protein